MSSKAKNPYADSEFLRASLVETKELMAAHNVLVSRSLTLAEKPYSIVLRLEAYDEMSSVLDKPLCSFQAHWPNAREQTFTAFLFTSHVMLARLVEDSRRDAWNQTLRAQKAV
jgi:hypothetical protein